MNNLKAEVIELLDYFIDHCQYLAYKGSTLRNKTVLPQAQKMKHYTSLCTHLKALGEDMSFIQEHYIKRDCY